MNTIPVIFLAFANDRVDDAAYLRNLPKELDGIRKSLYRAQEAGLCEVVERANATVENILDVFQDAKYRNRIAIFHYGGHANGYQLLLESVTGHSVAARSEGLVPFFAKQLGLKLIFLNGCSSQQQALDLIEAGIPAVIGTSQSINDDVATNLAIRFYRGLGNGAGIDKAWQEAIDEVKIQKGTANMRDLFWDGMTEARADVTPEAQPDRFPWDIFYKQGAEIIKRWNLPEQVGNPLFNLPDIPKIYNLPASPFLFLKRYERQHARLFFGRSYYTRELYNKVVDETAAPIILLYGQSGVGKSSLFDAGLNPRLEESHIIRYIRRDAQKGLLKALEEALAVEVVQTESPDEEASPVISAQSEEKELSQEDVEAKQMTTILQQQLPALKGEVKAQTEALLAALERKLDAMRFEADLDTSDQASSGFATEKELVNLPLLLRNWRTIETRNQKPLLIILDQVEELFTRPNEDESEELENFLKALEDVFGNPSDFPKGKLILGYRKEYNPEIEEGFKQHELPRTKIFLEHLSRKDIVDIFKGLSETPSLKSQYNLTVDQDLPVIVADDLLEDRNSPVAPVLQILLTKMWEQAKAKDPDHPQFTVELYQNLRREGILLDDFFHQQMRKLRDWAAELEISGLALDVLNYHTTRLGTAGSRNLDELRDRYQHREDVIDELIGKFKELYLLNDAGKNTTGLAHDTIAPLIQSQFRVSDKPGQRATRILENKLLEVNHDHDATLDFTELDLVEEGQYGMRYWVQKEWGLIEKSRKRKEKEFEKKKRLKRLGIAAIGFMVATAIFGLIQWNASKKLLRDLAISSLEYKSRELKNTNPTLAISMAKRYVEEKLKKDVSQKEITHVSEHLNTIMSESADKHLYQAHLKPRVNFLNAHFSPSERFIVTSGFSNEVKLWKPNGELVGVVAQSLKKMIGASFLSEDSILVVYNDGGYDIRNKQGEVLNRGDYGASLDLENPVWRDASHTRMLVKRDEVNVGARGGTVDDEYGMFGLDNEYVFINLLTNTHQTVPFSHVADHTDGNLSLMDALYAMSPTGRQYFIFLEDSAAMALYDLDQGYNPIFWSHLDFIPIAIAFSDNGELVAMVSQEGRALVYTASGELLHQFEIPEYNENFESGKLSFSKNGKLLLIPDLKPENSMGVFRLNGEVVTFLREASYLDFNGFSPNANYVFKSNISSGIHIWNMGYKRLKQEHATSEWDIQFTKKQPSLSKFAADRQSLVVVPADDTVQFRKLDEKINQRTVVAAKLLNHPNSSNERLVPAKFDDHFSVLDASGQPMLRSENGDTLLRFELFEEVEYPPTVRTEFSPDGNYWAAATPMQVQWVDMETREVSALSFANPDIEVFSDRNPLYDIDISNGKKVAIIRAVDLIEVFDAEKGLLLWNNISGTNAGDSEFTRICISPNEQYIAVSTRKAVMLIDIATEVVLDRTTMQFNEIIDIQFSENSELVKILTPYGVYNWSPVGRFLPKIEQTIDNESLKNEVEGHLREFNGKIIYSAKDPVFHRKALVYLILACMAFIVINRLMYEWDQGLHLTVGYKAPTYAILLLFPLTLQRFASSIEDLHSMFNMLQLILLPLFMVSVYVAYKDFMRKRKLGWAVTYLTLGGILQLISIYFLYRDYFRIFSEMDVIWASVLVVCCVFALVGLMLLTIKAWYAKKKYRFVFLNIIFGMGMLFLVFIFFIMLFGD